MKQFRLKGFIDFVRADSPYCVINTIQNVSFHCDKSLIPMEISDGSKVEFDVVPYDSQNRTKWKVTGVRHAHVTNVKHQKYLEAVDVSRGIDTEIEEGSY